LYVMDSQVLVGGFFFFENDRCFVAGFIRKTYDHMKFYNRLTRCVMLNAEMIKVGVPSCKNPK
jgi:hypothetical protein